MSIDPSVPRDPSSVADNPYAAGVAAAAPANPFGVDYSPQAKYVTSFLRKQTAYLRQQTAGSLSNTGQAGAAYVYVGGAFGSKPSGSGHASPANEGVTMFFNEPTGQNYRSLSAMMNAFEGWSFEKKQHMGKLLMMAGYGNKPNQGQSFDEALKSWTLADFESNYANLLTDASARFAQGKNITPQQLLEQNIRFNLANAGLKTDGAFDKKAQDSWWTQLNTMSAGDPNDPNSQNFTGTKSQTTRHVDIYSPEDTKGLVRAVLNQELGRDPTQAEMEDFSAALTHSMRANPDVTHTSQIYNNGEMVSENSVTHQGIGQQGLQEVATERAQAQPGWAEWQAIGTYLPALMETLGSAVPGT